MAILHGILAELGIARPETQRAAPEDGSWIREPRFDPLEGRCYELAFARIPPGTHEKPVIKRVRIDGPSAEDWFDLDAQRPLERALYAYTVKAYRPLDDDTGRARH